MRLHHLEVTAFGPFAETATVDFDALSDAGLFLLTGATGAGKTSVLDAVCFALYGEVPGDRQSAKRLRCDQAAEGVAPAVTLELSLSGRRFRVIRSPAWERPKKRGSGTTVEQASVRLFEQLDAGWTLLSHRLDEAGHLVTHLVGMNLAQFCQVAMLPQGRFQAFLRARSDERHRLLQQLFRTTRFEQVERWLRERRVALRRASERHHEVVADLVSRLSEAAGAPVPVDWDLHDLVGPAARGDLVAWSAGHRSAASDAAADATHCAEQSWLHEQAARSALDAARELARRQQVHAATVAEQSMLEADAADHRSRAERLAAARRAASVTPLHTVAARCTGEVREAELTAEARSSSLADLLGTLITPEPSALAASAGDAAAAARALLPREQTLDGLRGDLDTEAHEVDRLQRRADVLAQQIGDLPPALRDARAAHRAAADAARELVAVRVELEALLVRERAESQVRSLGAELEEARVLRAAAVDSAQHLTEAWLQLREERLNGMAAEIAGALAVGADCPVCGSLDHPHPASPRPGAPGADAERSARRRVDDAEATRLAHDDKVRDLQTRLALAEQQAGSDRDDIAGSVASARAEEARLSGLGAHLPRHAAEVASLEERHERLTAERTAVEVALAAARAALTHRRAEAEALARELADALVGTGCATVAALVDHHTRVADAARAAGEAAGALHRARRVEQDSLRELDAAALEAGFGSVGDALAAVHDERTLALLEQQVTAHTTAVARVAAVLEDDDLRAASTTPAPDLEQVQLEHTAAETLLTSARTSAQVQSARAGRLAALETDLRAALDDWAPVRDDLDLATRMAALTDGTSPDNRLQMRLSGYVLAWRLAQVVAAANERLGRMSDQRYSLEHTGRRGAGETRGGLSLLVRDDWSGETRDPATLSGGETFVVSLALALGLADVIAHEVGGTDLDTLFVDEGFGSLDADTLDDVMDTLDSLRDGGRVVGVVSHVAEMRDRIPAQLRVGKSRHGSTLDLAG